MRWNRLGVALSGFALVALAACSGSDGLATAPRRSATHSSLLGGVFDQGKDPTRQAPASAIGGARPGGTLTVLSSEGRQSMDPTQAYNVRSESILSGLVVRSLTQYVYDPKSKQMILVPDLATDLGRPSPDFMTWQFTLRSGVKFENGRPVTPEDIKYGIERSFDRKKFPHGAEYSNRYFLDGDTYPGPYRSAHPYRGVTIDGNMITIRMSKPFPDMSYWASFPAMSPIPPGKASKPATYQNHPWATGPYMFKRGGYKPGESLVLVRNPYWDPATDPGRHQYIKEFDFTFNTDPAKIDQIMLADTGSGRTTLSYGNILPADYPNFTQQAEDRLVLGSAPCAYLWYPDNRTITDINVRRALAYAYPYRAMAEAHGLIPGVTILPATNLMPPGVPGRVEYNPLPGHAPGSTDPARAKALLMRAGKLNFPIRFPFSTDTEESVAAKNALVEPLSAAGFDPQPVPTTFAKYFKKFQNNPMAEINLRTSSWCSDWPSGSAWFPEQFRTTDIATSGFGHNLAAFSAQAVDDRIDAIPRLLLTEQPRAWNALDRTIQTDYFPVIVTGYAGVAMMRGSQVHNVRDDTGFGMPTWKDIWLG